MANQLTINIGAAANDGTGDPLRTAFNEVNLNFANVWATGLPNSNVQFNNNRILTVNTNANLILAPNGIAKVVSNVGIVPNTSNVHDLGSSTNRWNTVYAQYLNISNDITFGDLTVDGNLTVTGNIIEIGNIITDAKTIQLANTASTANAANGSGITVGASDNIATLLYSNTANAWTTNIGLNITGNILPSANVTYNLGSNTAQWKDLWVSNSTIYMNSVPITLSAGNVLTVNGNAVLTNNSNTTVSTTGNVTANYFFGNGSQLTGLAATYGNANVAAYLASGTDTANIITTGNISGSYILGNGSQLTGMPATYGNANVVANLAALGSNPVSTTGNVTSGNLLTGGIVSATGNITGNYFIGNGSQLTGLSTSRISNGNSNVAIPTANGNATITANAASTWTFGTDSTLTLPAGSSRITSYGQITIETDNNASGMYLNADGVNLLYANANVTLRANSIGTNKDWNFGTDGNLTLPGNIIAINYLNGNRVTGDITFSGEAVIGTGTSNTQSGLYLAPDPVSLANDLYLRVRGNIYDEPTHIHFDTGNNAYYNQYIGDDNKYILLANTGNVVVNTNNNAGNSAQWTFGTGGTTQFPNSVILAPVGQSITMQSDQYSQLMWENANLTVAPNMAINSNFYVSQNNATLDIGYRDGSSTQLIKSWLWSVDGTLTLPTAGRITFDYLSISSDANVSAFYAPAGNVQLAAGIGDAQIVANSLNDSKTWTFGNTGNLTAPGNISAVGNISGGNLSLSGNITSDIGFTGATITINNAPGGNEGAEIRWALPSAANTVLTTSLVQDVFQNGMRFFEAGGNNRGLYMDLGNVPNGSSTAVGYRDIPQVSFTANATLAATDAGRHYYSTLATANTLTIANNTSVSWSVGTAISIVNRGSGNITIAQGSGVSLYLAGNATAGNRTVTTYGMATLLNVAANVWMINGSGVS